MTTAEFVLRSEPTKTDEEQSDPTENLRSALGYLESVLTRAGALKATATRSPDRLSYEDVAVDVVSPLATETAAERNRQFARGTNTEHLVDVDLGPDDE